MSHYIYEPMSHYIYEPLSHYIYEPLSHYIYEPMSHYILKSHYCSSVQCTYTCQGATTYKNQHCPKYLKLSRDILQSVDATKLNGAEWLGPFFRITFWTVLLFLNELQNMLWNSMWFFET